MEDDVGGIFDVDAEGAADGAVEDAEGVGVELEGDAIGAVEDDVGGVCIEDAEGAADCAVEDDDVVEVEAGGFDVDALALFLIYPATMCWMAASGKPSLTMEFLNSSASGSSNIAMVAAIEGDGTAAMSESRSSLDSELHSSEGTARAPSTSSKAGLGTLDDIDSSHVPS